MILFKNLQVNYPLVIKIGSLNNSLKIFKMIQLTKIYKKCHDLSKKNGCNLLRILPLEKISIIFFNLFQKIKKYFNKKTERSQNFYRKICKTSEFRNKL